MLLMACGEEAASAPLDPQLQWAVTPTPTIAVHQDKLPLPVLQVHFETPTPAPTIAPFVAPSREAVIAAEASGLPATVERWRGLVQEYFPAAAVDHVLWTINCESHGDPNAVNPAGPFQGLLQEMPLYHLAKAQALGFAVADLFDPRVNIAVAAVISAGGTQMGAWPVCG